MIQLTTALLALLPPGGIDSTVLPEPVPLARMEREIFDPRWLIPRATAAELAASPKGTVDLVAELKALLARRFEPADGTDALSRASTLGDLVALFAPVRDDRKAVDALLERLEAERPEVWAQVGWALPELVRERRFRSDRWDPADDRGDDGFLIAKPRDLSLVEDGPWKKSEGSTLAVQVATLIHADLGAIKAAENDFRTWPDRIGADYERIRPIPGSYLRGEDTEGSPFAALKVEFTCDIPFPFGSYDCDLRMLHRLDEDGCLISDVMSTSSDFYWLAGHDLFLPVLDAEGEWVSMLAVRVFGCDLRGVPDSNSHHEDGAREGLGNMKREAEKLWALGSERTPIYSDNVPVFAVHGP